MSNKIEEKQPEFKPHPQPLSPREKGEQPNPLPSGDQRASDSPLEARAVPAEVGREGRTQSGRRPTWPGPKSTALFEEEQRFIAPGIQSIALLSKLTIERGEGSRVMDVDGNSYLDFNVGVSVCSLGYSHPKYKTALKQQIDQIMVGSYTSKARLALVKRIASLTPQGLTRTQLFSSGAEAVEAALRLARSYTKKTDIIGFTGGFHGKTGGVLPLSDVDWKTQIGPLPTGMHSTPYPYTYRFNGSPEACLEDALNRLKELIRSLNGKVAAIIAEPVQGTAGNIVPPAGFLTQLKAIAHENGALYISDEMITGFGRTGKNFGCNYDDVQPDILTIGKGMGSGFPVSGVISTNEIVSAKPWSLPSAASSSYGGNPLASAAALSTIQTIVDDHLVENSAKVGAVLLKELKSRLEKYPFVGEVRGRGLLIGFELVKNRTTKEPLPKPLCEKFFMECLKRGLIMMGYAPRVRIHPPLTLTEAEALEGAAIMDEALAALQREVPSHG
jgi:4-aminobutyrate aminotransferase / (S)-3-amino-2-methylpropionate transaminase / 5-aminovalerate transaminase